MKPYQVTGGGVQISAATLLILTAGQVADRSHQVKVLDKVGQDGIKVEALALLTFKVGEIIGLAEVPKQAREQLIDLQAAEEAARKAADSAADAPAAAERPTVKSGNAGSGRTLQGHGKA